MVGVVARRKQVGNHAVTPVVIVGKHRRAHSERSEKRQENQPQQHHQDWFAIKHCAKIRMPRSAPQLGVKISGTVRIMPSGVEGRLPKLNTQEFAGGGARTHTILRSLDFESSASANSATPAAIKAGEKLQTPAESSRASDQVRIDSSQAERWCENLAQNDGFAQAGWRFE